jgi:DNA-binding Lrp family transcriptional regulator
MIRVLISVINGNNKLDLISKSIKASKSWLSRIIDNLIKTGFLKKERLGNLTIVYLAETSHAVAFKDMYLEKPYIKYESYFGRNIDVLLCIIYSPKSAKIVGRMLNVQPRVVRERLRKLGKSGIILKEKGKYSVSASSALLINFLQAYRKFPEGKGRALWKFNDETVIASILSDEQKGELTGFSKYSSYGIPMQPNEFLYYAGEIMINPLLVFVHSLLQINDSRTFALAAAFFEKNMLFKEKYSKKLNLYCEWFDVSEKFIKIVDIHKLLSSSNYNHEKLLKSGKYNIIGDELLSIFEMYGVINA